MKTLAHSFLGLLLPLICSLLLMSACSTENALPIKASPGTTLLVLQSVSDVFTVAWSPDGKHVALGEGDGSIQVCDALTGNVLLTIHGGHSSQVWRVACSCRNRASSVGLQ